MVARLKPEELAEARKRTGKLGGRPRRPTRDEAREAAIERLTPKALQAIERKLDTEDPDSWRAGVALLAYAWPKPAEQVEVRADAQVEEMTIEQLRALRSKLLEAHPELAALRVVD
jgi:hypothetical protein